VRLGIKAPRDISVHRKEVYDAIRRENRSALGKPDGYAEGRTCARPRRPLKASNG
jgi:sRNA-binding carbon storage regulator CsrA